MPKNILYAESFLRSGCLGLLLICTGLTGHATQLTIFHVMSMIILTVIWTVSIFIISRIKQDAETKLSFTADRDAWKIIGYLFTAFILLFSIISLIFRRNFTLDGFHFLIAGGAILLIQNIMCILLDWYRNIP